jgi:carbon-monoxide dehydrogenase small subunit
MQVRDRETDTDASTERSVRMRVNGQEVEARLATRTLLSEFLREGLHLTGTHVGCDTSQCGACAVLVDGRAVKSCTALAVQMEGHEVWTVEGLQDLAPDTLRVNGMHPLQAAFWEHHGLQCGFCTPGILMAAVDLLSHIPHPSDEEIRHALEGHLCRCTGYQNIVAAVRTAALAMAEGASVPSVEAVSTAGGEN